MWWVAVEKCVTRVVGGSREVCYTCGGWQYRSVLHVWWVAVEKCVTHVVGGSREVCYTCGGWQ